MRKYCCNKLTIKNTTDFPMQVYTRHVRATQGNNLRNSKRFIDYSGLIDTLKPKTRGPGATLLT